MRALKLRLIPDETLPVFQRLHHEVVETSLEEVLENGIHPWMPQVQPPDIVEGFLDRLNRKESRPPHLEQYPFASEVRNGVNRYYASRPRFEELLERINEEVLFCQSTLDFPGVLSVAKDRLRDHWNNAMVIQLAEKAFPQFSELRRFLKAKHPKAKLRGYEDLSSYAWSGFISLEDFRNHERLLIDEAITPLNFRVVEFLSTVTDGQGRLRMRDAIDHLQLTQKGKEGNGAMVTWQCQRQGSGWLMRPSVGSNIEVRREAEAFAKRWGKNTGKFCIRVETRDIAAMVEHNEATPSFPGLRYSRPDQLPQVSGQVFRQKMPVYSLGVTPRIGWHAERLKDILRDYDKPASGIKNELAQRIAQLAAEEYQRHEARLDNFFGQNRFIRASKAANPTESLRVLPQDDGLTGLLLHMYALRHLRGNVLMDPKHLNDACSIEDLASAVIQERVQLPGGLILVG